jgi:molybdopterin synthase sulfur carrier subunit
MEITVKLFATYQIGRFVQEVRCYSLGATARTVAVELELHNSKPGLTLINGRIADLNRKLNDGDTLALGPLMAGG